MVERTPEILCHYTTQEGLIGILKESALWATKIHFLNDATEIIKPLSIAREYLRKHAHYEVTGEPDGPEGDLLYQIESWEDVNTCIASFCANGDLLSQWRGYSVYGSSYSIGFDTKS